jgi:hypothetical protein
MGSKLPKAICCLRNCQGQFRRQVLSCHAQGIEVEILFYRKAVKKIGTDSPVFCGFAAKNAP